jgi:hypothetical protein
MSTMISRLAQPMAQQYIAVQIPMRTLSTGTFGKGCICEQECIHMLMG